MTDLAKTLAALSEAATQGTWGIWFEQINGKADAAIQELIDQVHHTDPIGQSLVMLDADGKCPAITGCGPTSSANAAFIVALVNAYRTGQLVPVPSVEMVARALAAEAFQRDSLVDLWWGDQALQPANTIRLSECEKVAWRSAATAVISAMKGGGTTMTDEVTQAELKPCPFCGCDQVTTAPDRLALVSTTWRVMCKACGASVTRDTEAEAIAAWNTRASDARIAELEAKVEQLECALRQIAETPNYRCFAASMRKIARAALGDK